MAEVNLKDGSETSILEGEGFSKLLGNIPQEGNTKPKEDENTKPDDGLLDVVETEEEKAEKELAEQEAEKKKLELEASKKPKITDVADEDSIISVFKEKYGEIEGEFEETLEGLEKYIDEVLPVIKEQTKVEAIEDYLESKPAIKALAAHLEAGYGLDSFGVQQRMFDYSKVAITDEEDNIPTQKELYRQALQVKGLEEEEIEDAIELATDKGTLKVKAETSKNYLVNAQKKEVDIIKAKEKEIYTAALLEEKKIEQEIDDLLKTGNLGGIKLDTNQVKALKEFGTKKDAKGVTEREKKYNNLTIEQNLILDQIVLNDFKGLGVKVNKDKLKTQTLQDLKKKSEDVKRISLNTTNSSNTKIPSPVTTIKDWLN